MSPLSEVERTQAPSANAQMWPDWRSERYAVPGAKGSPIQSVFRRWDFGNASIALGSFGSSLGTPYAAAYPRPLFAAAMGKAGAWVCMGTGCVPDGALSLELRASYSFMQWLYREDLWGARTERERVWEEPLRLHWDESPWSAYERMFASFPMGASGETVHAVSQCNSWGDFKKDIFDLRATADRAVELGARLLVLDDKWETWSSSAIPDRKRFPRFDEDLEYIRRRGLQLGFWQSVGWVDDPASCGLGTSDLIVGRDGKPRRAAWDGDPRGPAHFVLDPSSERSLNWLRERTLRLMREFRPALLKLDFGYALTNPNTGVPRNPDLRGERFAFTLLKTIATAAREANPHVTLQYYGLHPLMREVTTLVALDDLGDAGDREADGHGIWSVWAALAGAAGTAIMASSGYQWEDDAEIVLDTAVIGAPGTILPRKLVDGSAVPLRWLQQRAAINRWHRRTTRWRPLWLNTSRGAEGKELRMGSLGRLETVAGEERLTALALRRVASGTMPGLDGFEWSGRWALIAQSDEDIRGRGSVACIAVDGGRLRMPRRERPVRVVAVSARGESAWRNWEWRGGVLALRAESLPEGILGFVVS
jgi:hypothetical protein